jgi:hypothetical protein
MSSARAPRPQVHDDDDLPELPEMVGDDEPGAGLDFDEPEEPEGDESVGLDVSTGTEDDGDFLERLDEGDEGSGWEAEEETLEEDPELDGEDEGGWTEGSEDSDVSGWDSDLDGAEDEAAAPLSRDAGEEGVEERHDASGDDDPAADLPPVPAEGEDALADDLELEDEGEIDLLPDADERAEHPALALPRAAVEALWLGPEDEAITAIGGGLAAGRRLYRIDGAGLEPLDLGELEGDEVTSIARMASGATVVGLQLGGIARAAAAGRFSVLDSIRRAGEGASVGAFHVLGEPHASGVRLWGRTRGGALVRSDDEGSTWSRPLIPGAVPALGPDGAGGVVGVTRGRGALRLLRTADGGRSWRNVAGPTLPELPDEHELHVAALGPLVVLTTDVPGLAPFVTRDDGQRWEVLDPLRDVGSIALVREAGVPVLYAGLLAEGTDRGVVVRAPLAQGEGAAGPEIVVDLEELRSRHHVGGAGDPEGDQRVHALVAEPGEGETTLWIGSGLGLVRARVKRA